METYKFSDDTIDDIKELKKTFNKSKFKLLEKKEKKHGLVKTFDGDGYPIYELENGVSGSRCWFDYDKGCVVIDEDIELNTEEDHMEYLKEHYEVTGDEQADEELYEERCNLVNGVTECHNYNNGIWSEIQDELSILLEMEGFVDFAPADEISFETFNYEKNIKLVIYSNKLLEPETYEVLSLKE